MVLMVPVTLLIIISIMVEELKTDTEMQTIELNSLKTLKDR